MTNYTTWLIDFDDTLASGSLTWATRYAFPKLVRDNNLTVDPTRLHNTMLRLQKRSNQAIPLDELLRELFESMDWPRHLETPFIRDLTTSYRPALFDDALPFLERLKSKQRRVIILSNNPHAYKNVVALALEPLVDAVYTPYNVPDIQPKPHRSLWDYLLREHLDVDPALTCVVGDDPWSDGAFASICGLQCWIVDRSERLRGRVDTDGYQLVRSLDEILV